MALAQQSSNGHAPRAKSAKSCAQCGTSAFLTNFIGRGGKGCSCRLPEGAKWCPKHAWPAIRPICRQCYDLPWVRRKYLCRELPLPPKPTSHPRGTEGKIEAMAWRAARGFSLFHPGDNPTLDDCPPGILGIEAQWREVMGLPKLRARGYERHGDRWRARPTLDGERFGLKVYDTEQEASDAVMRFWRKRLGLFAELGGSMKSFRLKQGGRFRIRILRGKVIWPDERITARVPQADDPLPVVVAVRRRSRWRQRGLFDGIEWAPAGKKR